MPPALPADREGIGAFPAAGPYYVAEYRPGDTAVLRRNPFYGGRRPQHVDGFAADLRATSPDEVLDRVERGESDWGFALAEEYFDPGRRLAARYGVNRSRFFVTPGTTTFGFVLNTARPLFRDNPRLRQALKFAVDRAALRRAGGSELQSPLTDQYLPPGFPGFRDADIYPSTSPTRPGAEARARKHTGRQGRALHRRHSPAPRGRAEPPPRPRKDRAGRRDRRFRPPRISAGSGRPAPRISASARGSPTTPTPTRC